MVPGDWNVYNGIEELYMHTVEEADKTSEDEGGTAQ